MTTPPPNRGSLTVVGIGIQLGQTTLEAKAHLETAEKVFYLVSNPIAERWIQQLNPTAQTLYDLYTVGKPRQQTYDEMVARMLEPVRQGQRVCTAFYGHPGVFVDPGHRAVRYARQEGHEAVMLAGVSAEDILFAELGVDPSRFGCLSYEATDFLVSHRRFDVTSSLVLWQVGSLGDISYQTSPDITIGLELLLERLLPEYGEEHPVTLFEGSLFPICPSRKERIRLGDLRTAAMNSVTTLYLPPLHQQPPDMALVRKMGLDRYLPK